MALMITLDDAVKVLEYCCQFEDEGTEELIRSELEQKCYSILKPNEGWFAALREMAEAVTEPGNIAFHIAEGDLKKWLEMYRDNMIAMMTQAAMESGKMTGA